MTRLDQLSKPIRRNGEHISAIVEREKRMHLEANGEQPDSSGTLGSGEKKRMSRSMTHLAAPVAGAKKGGGGGGLQKSATSARVGGSRSALGGSRPGEAGSGGKAGGGGRGGLKPAKSLCHLDGSGGPGFSRIVSKVAQHFIRNSGNNGNNGRGKEQEEKSGSFITFTRVIGLYLFISCLQTIYYPVIQSFITFNSHLFDELID